MTPRMPAADRATPVAWTVFAAPAAMALTLVALSVLVAGATVGGVDAAEVGLILAVPCVSIAGAAAAARWTGLDRVASRALFPRPADPGSIIETIAAAAARAQSSGRLSLVDFRRGDPDPLLGIGLHLVVIGAEPRLIRAVLERRLDEVTRRRWRWEKFLEAAGRFGPPAGMVLLLVAAAAWARARDGFESGWTWGLGAAAWALAMALLATVGPRRGEACRTVARLALSGTLVIEGVLAVSRGLSPEAVVAHLRTFLPPPGDSAAASAAA